MRTYTNNGATCSSRERGRPYAAPGRSKTRFSYWVRWIWDANIRKGENKLNSHPHQRQRKGKATIKWCGGAAVCLWEIIKASLRRSPASGNKTPSPVGSQLMFSLPAPRYKADLISPDCESNTAQCGPQLGINDTANWKIRTMGTDNLLQNRLKPIH